jgi:hypothetical protein
LITKETIHMAALVCTNCNRETGILGIPVEDMVETTKLCIDCVGKHAGPSASLSDYRWVGGTVEGPTRVPLSQVTELAQQAFPIGSSVGLAPMPAPSMSDEEIAARQEAAKKAADDEEARLAAARAQGASLDLPTTTSGEASPTTPVSPPITAPTVPEVPSATSGPTPSADGGEHQAMPLDNPAGPPVAPPTVSSPGQGDPQITE